MADHTHRWFEVDSRSNLRAGPKPVQTQSDTAQVVPRSLEIQRCRGVRGVQQPWVNALFLQSLDEARESVVLPCRERRIGVRNREVGEDTLEGEAVVGFDHACDLERFDGASTDTVHPGIELQMHRIWQRCRVLRNVGEQFDERGPIRRWCETVGNDEPDLLQGRFGQHEDRHIDVCLPEPNTLLDEGNRQP